ncbi:MAG: DNA alkylation repair protein, partial [Candidatus Paceibacterota bacterium]
CDTMCSEVITRILEKTPKEIVTLFNWRNAKNKWLRRSLLVTVVKLKNKIENWQRVALKILSSFSKEEERIVKKAVHWLEREIN